MSIRIGGVPYGVGAPLLAGMDQDPAVDLLQAPPTQLIAKLRSGQLDAALVSSIEAIRQPNYVVAEGIGIACKSEIRSVRAFRRRGTPIKTVGLDNSSATSVALLRLLLANVHVDDVAHGVTFETIEPNRAPDELPHDLVLLIGDNGLLANDGDREPWDLGKQWVQWTGLPFVFALWVIRKDANHAAILEALHEARARGRELGAVDGTDGAAHYDLDGQDLRGLCRFWDECRALQLATEPDPEMIHE